MLVVGVVYYSNRSIKKEFQLAAESTTMQMILIFWLLCYPQSGLFPVLPYFIIIVSVKRVADDNTSAIKL